MKFWFILLFFIPNFAFAQDLTPDQEARFHALGREIRCVVCKSEPVATSSAEIAQDMRKLIKARILLGENDNQIRDYFAKHYGEYVLLRPMVSNATYALWAAPLIMLLFGILFLLNYLKSKPNTESSEVSIDDAAALNALEELEIRDNK